MQRPSPTLYMLLLGSKAPARNVEQHDYFFGIAHSLKELVPQIKAFWPEAGNSLHIDGWREVNQVDGYRVRVCVREEGDVSFKESAGDLQDLPRLFFVNLGGYQSGKLEEQHYTVLSVQSDRARAIQEAKKSVFFKANSIKGANAHIDEKYGVDVDDIYRIEDILSPALKQQYRIELVPDSGLQEDPIHLGYFRLEKLAKSYDFF